MADPSVTPESLVTLQQSNQRRLAGLQGQGMAASIGPAWMIEMLIEKLIGPTGSPEWVEFLYSYETRVSTWLDSAEAQVARAKLMAPVVPLPPNGGRSITLN